MLKVEADTLEEAYKQASSKLECSITQLHFEIIQHPKSGFLGMFKKTAIIVATCKSVESHIPQKERPKKQKPTRTVKPQRQNVSKPEPKPYEQSQSVTEPRYSVEDDAIFDNFYDEKKCGKKEVCTLEIEQSIKRLFSTMCFDLDSIEVSMLDEATVFINIQGKDAALLIGKEGYRYKAISYMLFNWINAKYGLLTRVEIAQFLESQEKMIANYIKPVIAQIEQNGKGSTKPLDGILVQIALKQLRQRFPDKYVGIKTNNFDEKYIIVNDFKK
jgi:spoIIIJ-associated protein